MNIYKLKNGKYIFVIFFIIVYTITFLNKPNEFLQEESVQTSINNSNKNDLIRLPVIMYHNISKKQKLVNKYCVSQQQFENDLKYIQSKGYNCISTKELIDYVYNGYKLPEKPFMITFDDGHESFYEIAYPLLKKYNMKAIMSIVGEYTNLYSQQEDHNIDYSYLNWKQVNELNNNDFTEIQNHTFDMHKITSIRKGAGKAKGESFEDFKKILIKDTKKLNTLILNYTGKKSNIFTYPYGNISEKSEEILKEIGFLGAFTCSEKVNFLTGNPDELYKIGRFNRDGRISTLEFFKKIENDKNS